MVWYIVSLAAMLAGAFAIADDIRSEKILDEIKRDRQLKN